MQTWSDEQLLPHLPQLLTSLVVSTQLPLQSIWPEGHSQAPALQICPVLHRRPQASQLEGSVWRSTQLVPHAVCPEGHEVTHRPAEHA
jgi:hypothetical protein